MESSTFDTVVRKLARSGSRRRVVQALAAGVGMALASRSPAPAEGGIRPVRCFKRGEQCIVDGQTPCCGRLACGPTSDPLVFTCQKVGRIKPA